MGGRALRNQMGSGAGIPYQSHGGPIGFNLACRWTKVRYQQAGTPPPLKLKSPGHRAPRSLSLAQI